jgi:hypothetical protein
MDQKSGKPSQKRRAILQGSLAAPVVLTVASPAAAQMTTLGRCLLRDAEKDPLYLVDTKTYDTWLRIRVQVYKLTRSNGDVLSEYAFFDEGLGVSGGYRHVPAPHNPVLLPNGVNASNMDATPNGERWGLKWVNEVSKVESSKIQIEPPTGYRSVTGTCWSSFKTGI